MKSTISYLGLTENPYDRIDRIKSKKLKHI